MKRQQLTSVHSISGLIAGIFILLLSLSGSLLMFHDEIDAVQQPMVGLTKIVQQTLTADSCYKIVQQQYPLASISSCNLPVNEGQLFSFTIYDSSYQQGRKPLQVFIHPKTGNVLMARGGSEDIKHNFMSWLAGFHSSFHAGKLGEWLLGFLAIVFLVSIISGIILYRRKIMPVLFFSSSVWKKNNMHQVIGAWALLFNLMISITGLWMQRYVFKKEFYQSNDWVNTVKASPDLSFNFDSAYHNLKKSHPDFTGYVVYFAQSPKGKTAIYGSNSTNAFIHSKKFADVISLDSSGAVYKTRLVNENSTGDYYDIVNSQLHMGKYGGWPIKIIYSFFGLTSGILSITGFLLWRKRKKRSRM
jgi:uncharacterized iron-regulated membrane protein